MWINSVHAQAPLTKLCSMKFKFQCIYVQENSFFAMNKINSKYVILSYSKFSAENMIHTDDIKTQPRGVIIKNCNPVDFYSCKLKPSHINYTPTERFFLIIVDTPKEFHTII